MKDRQEGESCDKSNKAEFAIGEGGTHSPQVDRLCELDFKTF